MQSKKKKLRWSQIILHTIFIFFSILCIAPILLVGMVSITENQSLMVNGFSYFPKEISFEAYKYIFYDAKSIVNSYVVTILITIAGTILSLLITSLYAYPISRKDLPCNKVFTFIVFFVMLFNGGLVSSYIINTRILHFNNNIIALLVPFLITPFNVLIMKTFFQNTIPASLLEAAKLDGASEFRIYKTIIIPLSKPVLATVGLFNTLGYWNDWFSSLLYISNRNLFTIQFVMYKSLMNIEFLKNNIAAGAGGNLAIEVMNAPSQGIRFAMVVIGVGPMLLAYPFFQRYFIEGLTVGSIKG